MGSDIFAMAFQWVLAHGYLMIFIAMILGGPVFVSAAAFASALGFFNVYIIFLLSLVGELVVDALFYLIGYIGRLGLIEKYGHYLGLPPARVIKLEELLAEHTWKTLVTIKLSPLLPMPGFMLVGAIKMPLKRFIFIMSVIGLPKSLFFTILGFYFGKAYNTFAKYYDYGSYFIIFFIILFILINYLYRRFSRNAINKNGNL